MLLLFFNHISGTGDNHSWTNFPPNDNHQGYNNEGTPNARTTEFTLTKRTKSHIITKYNENNVQIENTIPNEYKWGHSEWWECEEINRGESNWLWWGGWEIAFGRFPVCWIFTRRGYLSVGKGNFLDLFNNLYKIKYFHIQSSGYVLTIISTWVWGSASCTAEIDRLFGIRRYSWKNFTSFAEENSGCFTYSAIGLVIPTFDLV